MKKRIEEQVVISLSVIKWIILATIIGVIVGFATGGFLKVLGWSIKEGQSHPLYFLTLPLALFASALIIKLAPDAQGHGTEKVIEAIHKRNGNIKAAVVPVKLAATVVTLASGGSAGKEGPCAQIGAGLASVFARIFRFDEYDRKKLVVCGISAGFASVFGTPIAGAIFGVEVLFIGSIMYDVILPSFISGIISYNVTKALGITYFYNSINIVPIFSQNVFLELVGAGFFFGLCSFFLVEMLKLGEFVSSRIKIWEPFKGLIGGVLLIGIALVFSTKYLGLGLSTIEDCLKGGVVPWYSVIVKAVTTSITLSFGGSGGIVTPIFFIGAVSGVLFALAFNLNTALFSAIGMVSLLAGAANTPIAASIMAVELFGSKVAPYAAIACVISFFVTGHRSVYPSQILGIRKSKHVDVELGKEIELIEPGAKTDNGRIFKYLFGDKQ